ncbi:MAG: F0F1 ATP synthase subunit gamma [Magnetospiraceae bacterium]
MATLKDLRNRISSVKSTQKITSAMKMVAAAKLRKAQMSAEAARPFSGRMGRMVSTLAGSAGEGAGGSPLLAGTGQDDKHLIVVVSSDRGLCGGFNANVSREVRGRVHALRESGKTVRLLFVGRKAKDSLARDFRDLIDDTLEGLLKTGAQYADASDLGTRLLSMYENGDFDVCTMVYTEFQSAMTQTVKGQQILPVPIELGADDDGEGSPAATESGAIYEYEPSEEDILNDLLPRNLNVQLFKAFLESYASEQGARMTAMDNATRNAGDMIDGLTLTYNRTRQANITRELIEIISGAEAL